jgi:hypothetical protein
MLKYNMTDNILVLDYLMAMYQLLRGAGQRGWLRHNAGSIPDEVIGVSN